MCASLFTKSLNIIMLSSVQIVRYVRSANADSERCVVCTVSIVFIAARQHAMPVESEIVLPILSVRLSDVQCRYCV